MGNVRRLSICGTLLRVCFGGTIALILANCGDAARNYEARNESQIRGTNRLDFADSTAEHNLRKQQLEELASNTAASPRFYEYLVKKSDFPELSNDEPILRVVFEEKVFFDTSQWSVRTDAMSALQIVASVLRRQSAPSALFVAGHTDSRGGDAYNQDLSIKRANSVAQRVVRLGVGSAKIYRIGFGKSVPLRPNDTDTNMAANRRVEFILASNPVPIGLWLGRPGDFLCSPENEQPEICKLPEKPRETFAAAPVQMQPPPSAENIPYATDKTSVNLPKMETIDITIQPPAIQHVGRPSR